MKIIKILLMYQPRTSHISSLKQYAMNAVQAGAIKVIPAIVCTPASIGEFWILVMEMPEEDWPFWFGFAEGKNFSISNRQIILGVECE